MSTPQYGPPQGEMRVCMSCGRQIPVSYYNCPHCGAPAGQPRSSGHEAFPIIGGVFEILAGISGLIVGILLAIGGGAASMIPLVGGFGAVVLICGIIVIIFGAIALLGGIMAIQRKSYGIALVGAIFSLFCGWFILGLLALIFIIIGKDAFRN